MKNNLIITAVVAVAVGVAAFVGGMKYQQGKMPAGGNGPQNMQFGQGRNRGGNGGMRPVVGDILNVDDKSITVKLSDGSTKLILLSESTSINTATTAAKSELKTGVPVAVFGTANNDGSVTAQNISLRPMMMLGNRGGQGSQASPNPSTSDQTQSGQSY